MCDTMDIGSGMDQPMMGDYPVEVVRAPLPTSRPGVLTSLGVDVQLLAQSIVYCSIVLCGLLVAVPVGVTSVSQYLSSIRNTNSLVDV